MPVKPEGSRDARYPVLCDARFSRNATGVNREYTGCHLRSLATAPAQLAYRAKLAGGRVVRGIAPRRRSIRRGRAAADANAQSDTLWACVVELGECQGCGN